MIPVPGYEGRRVGVLGCGRSGLAVALALAEGGATPVLWDDGEGGRQRAEAAGHAVADLARPREMAGLAALIVSPGIAHLFPEPHRAIRAAWEAGVPVDNDIGLWFRARLALDPEDGPAPRIVAITGSNGKSTTTALVAHILGSTGRHTQMGGNIGRAVFDLDAPEPGGVVVLELSSYQIEPARSLAPDIAVFLNLSPDHLDRHGGLGGYFAAKRRLFEAGAPERAVICLDDPYGRFLANTVEGSLPVIPVATTERPKDRPWAVFMTKSHLCEWRGGKQVAAVDLRAAPALAGVHNHQNAVAAWAVARALGVGPARIEQALVSFPGLAHRMERLGSAAGVLWVNDSKATNAEAAARALACFERVRWIAGGRPKEGGIAALAPFLARVEKAYLVGEAAEAFAAELGGHPYEIVGDLAAAVARARAEAAPGDTVLLSPAAASFDQFPDFEARGEAFRALVAPFLEQETPA